MAAHRSSEAPRVSTRLIALYAILALLLGGAYVVSRECPSEYGGVACTWYADTQGNGKGETYSHIGNLYYYWG